MGYGALTAFLDTEPEDKSPEGWAKFMAAHWSRLSEEQLEERLVRFFTEFERLCEFEKAAKASGWEWKIR
jgi:hypothetical protein